MEDLTKTSDVFVRLCKLYRNYDVAMEEDFNDALYALNKKAGARGKVTVSGYSVAFTITGPSAEALDEYVTRLKNLWKNIGYDVESTLEFGYIYAMLDYAMLDYAMLEN